MKDLHEKKSGGQNAQKLKEQYAMASKLTNDENLKILEEFEELNDPIEEGICSEEKEN